MPTAIIYGCSSRVAVRLYERGWINDDEDERGIYAFDGLSSTFWHSKYTGGVAPLASVLPQSTLATLTAQARAGAPTQADAGGTVVTSTLLNQLQATSPQTYNATTDLVVNGDLTLGGGASTFRFKSLYVTGNLTLNGNTATSTTSLYVGGSFTISGPSGTSSFGPTYVGGNVNWGGALSVHASPLYVAGNFVTQGGPFSHVLGPTYVGGSVTIAGNQASFLCPILVTPGQITTSGSAAMGTVAAPMVLLQNGGATGTTITNNLILNCDRAIAFGAGALTGGLVAAASLSLLFSKWFSRSASRRAKSCFSPSSSCSFDCRRSRHFWRSSDNLASCSFRRASACSAASRPAAPISS